MSRTKSTLRSTIAGLACLAGLVALGAVCRAEEDATGASDALARAESRLRAIYERGEFRAERFRGEWLPDSSGYTVRESASEAGAGGRSVLARYDVESGERSVVDPPPRRAPGLISPDGTRTIVSERGNLYVRDVASGAQVALTRDGDDDGVSYRGAVWSPDGKRIAFVRSDASRVRHRPILVPDDPTYPSVHEVRFARVGGTIASLRVGVADARGEEIRWLAIPTPSEGLYLGQVDWAVSSDELLVEKLSRFRDEREFLLCDVRTGELRRIFHETDPAWVVASYGKNSGLTWIRGGHAFVVLSEKDGWRHAYLYARDGRELALLTPGPYDIIERSIIDEANGWLYFYASPDDATRKRLFRVSLEGDGDGDEGRELIPVTPADQPGTHDYDISPDARWAFHTWSTFDTTPVTDLVRLPDHTVLRVLEDNSELRERLQTLGARATELFSIEIPGDAESAESAEDADDDAGILLDAWMIRPEDFDPTREYPVLVHVYGEPHAQTVLDAWGHSHALFHHVIADLGYLVVSIDNRGTPAPKGAAWRRAVFGSLGPLSTEEQAAALRALGRARPYVDLSRVGIWGWSGGGSNTLNAMFRRPDVYHVGIAVAPKPQPHLYNAWFQEIYMSTPEVNPEGYERSAPLHYAAGLEGDLLIVHGTGETNTHLQITEGLVDRLIELGKPFDYMAYPHRDHGLREGRGTAVHLRMLMARYFTDHLPPGPRPR